MTMDDRTTMQAVGACLDSLGLRHEIAESDTGDTARVRFTGHNGRFRMMMWLDHGVDGQTSLIARAYAPVSGDATKPVHILAVAPARVAELYVLLNLINAKHLRAGAFYLDPADGDVTFGWSIPITEVPAVGLIDQVIAMSHALDHHFPDVRAVALEGRTAYEAFEAHLARDEAELARAEAEAEAAEAPADVPDPELDDWDDAEDEGPLPFRRVV